MAVLLHNQLTGASEKVSEGAGVRIGPGGVGRDESLKELLTLVLAYLEIPERTLASGAEAAEVVISPKRPAPKSARIWLRAAPLEKGDASGAPPGEFSRRKIGPEDLRWLNLRTHYRAPLVFSWQALESARGERVSLVESGRALLALGRTAGNPTGIHAYRRRFSAALENDLDDPGALAALWDGLRPGALSPGSRLELLRSADCAFKIGIF